MLRKGALLRSRRKLEDDVFVGGECAISFWRSQYVPVLRVCGKRPWNRTGVALLRRLDAFKEE